MIVFSIPAIWRMEDADGDGRADKREALYTGFDFKDTHGMSSNYVYWIDGWIYGCHGFRNRSEVRDRSGRTTVFDSGNTYRFRPDGSQIEVFTHGQTNPFGLTVDPLGNFYSADSHSKPVMLLQHGGYYAGIGKNHDGLGFAPTITDDDHGSSAIAGIAYYADDKFPAEFRDNLFNGNPVTRRINRALLEWHGSTPKAIRMPDFLTCDDPWFRPIQIKLGPDGALYISDFYNPIIGHYEFPLADPRRDHQHGRIWRVIYRGGEAVAQGSTFGPPVAPIGSLGASSGENASPSAKANAPGRPGVSGGPPETTGQRPVLPMRSLPDLTRLDAAGLIEKLADRNLETRRLATNELVERVGKESAPTIRAAMLRTEDQAWIPEALWALERVQSLDPELFGAVLTGDSGGTVLAAAQVLAERAALAGGSPTFPTAEDTLRIFGEKIYESQPAISRVAAFGLARSPSVLNLRPLMMKWDAPQGDFALAYSVRMALRDNLRHPGIYEEIGRRFVGDEAPVLESNLKDPRFHADDLARLAEVSLAVPTADSAAFLLAHLQRTKLVTPRASEFLRHIVLHLPEEKLGTVSALMPLAGEPLSKQLPLADALGQAARQRGWKLPNDLAAWTQRTLLAALDSSKAALIDRAIAALRDATWPEKFAPLEEIVLDPQRDHSHRAAALEAAVNVERGPALAAHTLADPTSLPLRKKAAELLGRTPDDTARTALLAALPTAPAELALSITVSLAKTDPGFSALLDLLEDGKASPAPLRHRLIAILITQRAAALRARADALTKNLPPEDTRLDQLIAARARSFASAPPDATKGAQVFSQNCAACHRFRNSGGNVGPNLDGVGARGPARLIEDILDPNRNVDPLFRQTTVETTSGEIYVGANLREQGETIVLADASGREFTIPKSAIRTQTGSALSLMPAIYETALAPADLHALVAYLVSPAPETSPPSSH